ncbi:MAG: hypothetical protein SF053_15600 [Bacteroidia bacterium]|nr:hypothetical protein [Bacteroidia bacterium]
MAWSLFGNAGSLMAQAGPRPVALQDAFSLRRFMDAGLFHPDSALHPEVLKLLRRYMDPNQEDSAQIVNHYRNNPFLNLYMPLEREELNGEIIVGGVADQKVRNLPASDGLGALNIATLADGMSRFLIARAREELNLAFFDRFRRTLDEPEFVPLRILFPATWQALQDADIIGYATYLDLLREAFEKDLQNLPQQPPVLVRDTTFQRWFAGHPALLASLLAGSELGSRLVQGEHPVDILAYLGQDPDLAVIDTNFSAAAQLGTLLIQSLAPSQQNSRLQSTSQVRFVEEWDDIQRLLTDTLNMRLYLGFLYESGPKDIVFIIQQDSLLQKVTFRSALRQAASDRGVYTRYRLFLREFCARAIHLQDNITALASARTPEERTPEDLYGFVQASLDMFELGMTGASLIDPTQQPDPEHLRFLYILRQASELSLHVSQQNYAPAILNTVCLLDTLLPDTLFACKQELIRYGVFMAALVAAETPEEAAAVLEAAVLPPGSSRVKRVSSWNVAVNAYLGGYWGRESETDVTPEAQSFGMYAPIGLTVSRGLYRRQGSGYQELGALSLLLTLADLGAVTAYRVQDTLLQPLPRLELRNIISPGFGVVYGLPSLPVSVGATWQVGPLLRSYQNGTPVIAAEAPSRLMLILAVDIPLFNLYTRPRY